MVIDTSAAIAILRLEPEADAFLHVIADAEECLISAVSALETAMVLAGTRGGAAVWSPLDELLSRAQIEIAPFDRAQALLARDAFTRFGKGRHPAGLNLGDCASYALAASRKLPLLFKSGDFARTDIAPALPLPSPH